MTSFCDDTSPFSAYRSKAKEIYRTMRLPLFYDDMTNEIVNAKKCAAASSAVSFACGVMKGRADALGHGFAHAEKVAIESAAIVYAECGLTERSERIAEAVLVAGYLHDIRRDERDHPRKGAEEALLLMKGRINDRLSEMAAFAIRNHEAFKEPEHVSDSDFMLCSNALYDADKFRWGPDNFLYTIWDMAESMGAGIQAVMGHYEKGMEGVAKIKSTFRTKTGQKYGPEFIDAGLSIGIALYDFYRKKNRNLT
jgi:hypothetical protein